MHTHGNPVASVPKMGFIASMLGDELPDESDMRSLRRYFFLLPIQHRKQKKQGTSLTHPVIHNSFDIASCSRKCLFLREAKVKLTKIMQNGKSLFCMRISHAKRLVYNGMR